MSQGHKVKAIRVPGGQEVRLETDLPIGDLTKIAAKHGLNWMFMVANPEMGTGVHLVDLYELACRHAGVVPDSEMTARKMLAAIVDVDDDMPEEYEDDGRPKEDAPTTG